jgi:thiamine-phosphate diphosphorylase
MALNLPPLYPVTPDSLRGDSLLAWAGELLEAGCLFLQYRRKTGADRDRLEDLQALLARCGTYGCRVVVDDRTDLVMLSGADGVHLGQTDLPPSEARQLLGTGKLIGFSTHTWEQAEEAFDSPSDYLALGPVFGTASKSNPDPVVPVQVQERILRASPPPVVAIGGITPINAPSLWDRGFASLAVIGALAERPGEAWRAFMAARP